MRHADPCKKPGETWEAFIARRRRETRGLRLACGRAPLAEVEVLVERAYPVRGFPGLAGWLRALRRKHPKGGEVWVELPLETLARLAAITSTQPDLFEETEQ